jgi:hypothetical protein
MFQGGVGRFTFNDGTPAPMTSENPVPLVPLPHQPARPFNVVRSTRAPIHDNTAPTNQLLSRTPGRRHLEVLRLVTTQWPLMTGSQAVPVPASQTGEIFFTFAGTGPGSSASSAHDNVKMETFDQFKPELRCIVATTSRAGRRFSCGPCWITPGPHGCHRR